MSAARIGLRLGYLRDRKPSAVIEAHSELSSQLRSYKNNLPCCCAAVAFHPPANLSSQRFGG